MPNNPIGIAMIGCGTVGGGVARLLRDKADLYAGRIGRPVELRRVLVRDVNKAARTSCVPRDLLTNDAEAFFATQAADIVVEVAGGDGMIEDYFRRALKAGKHVVTANKSLLAARGSELFALARANNVSVAFEASCAGGIPCITALQFGLMANRIDALYGILNGTCNYILTEMTRHNKTYATALQEAQKKGFAEADPTLDVSGTDAAQKLAILGSLAFDVRIDEQQVALEGIDDLDLSDIGFGRELGYDIKLLAIAERKNGAVSLGVQPCFVPSDTMIAQVDGGFNALSVYGDAVGQTMYTGPGAGSLPTASAVVSDILNIAGGWYPIAFARMHQTSTAGKPARLVSGDELVSGFYLRVNALDTPGVMTQITRLLGDQGISLSAVLQHESAAGEFVPVVITTHDARGRDVRTAAQKIAALDVIQGNPRVIRIVRMPG